MKKFFKIFAVVITIILNIIGLVSLFPKISLNPIELSKKEYPFENLFVLSNNSIYYIHDIECKIVDKNISGKLPAKMYSKSPGGRTASGGIEKIQTLGSERSTAIDLTTLLGLLVSNPEQGSMTAEITYKPFIFPVILKQHFSFKLYKMIDGKYQWGEVAQ